MTSLVASGHLFRPHLAGAWQSDAQLGRLLPPLVWLAECPAKADGGEALVTVEDPASGAVLPLVWRSGGRLRAALDLVPSIDRLRAEDYHPRLIAPISARLPFNYSILPNWLKGAAQTLLSRLDKPKDIDFPATPWDSAADFLAVLEARLSGAAAPALWPDDAELALTVSHDVDTAWVLRHPKMLDRIATLEEAHGFRSTWHLVSNYLDDPELAQPLADLRRRGHELGSHGDNHDTKHPFAPAAERERRWAPIVRHGRQFAMAGFRSAWLARTPEFLDDLAALGVFSYDSSVPNSLPAGVARINGGCATMRPFFIRPGLVELPVTAFLENMAKADPRGEALRRLLETGRQAGALITIIMHPQPHQSANDRVLDYYERVLDILAAQPRAWKCRQQDAADWYRDRP